MNPKKAIKTLETAVKEGIYSPPLDTTEAVKLGIEALEFFQEFKKVTGNNPDARLPSETEE